MLKWFALWLLLFTASFIEEAKFMRKREGRRFKWAKRRLYWGVTNNVPSSIISIFDAIVTIATLGYRPQGWTLSFAFWRTLRDHRKYKEKHK